MTAFDKRASARRMAEAVAAELAEFKRNRIAAGAHADDVRRLDGVIANAAATMGAVWGDELNLLDAVDRCIQEGA